MKAQSTSKSKIGSLRPTIVGAGLIALDVVVNTSTEEEPKYFAGGTCGNVLTILSFLGWDSKPIARLNEDRSAEWLVEDLERWGVDSRFITCESDGSTPVVIQNIRQLANGKRTHSFSMRCPCCNAYLPGYKSILGKAATEIANALPRHQVFFFDRVSRGTLHLAQASKDKGALIVFEPSGIGEPRLFREAWSIAHVVKFSNDRIRDIADLDLQSAASELLLEIETLGEDGLRYRSHIRNAPTRGWKTLKVIPATQLRDSAGSGDWCTAGIIQKLARGGLSGFSNISTQRLRDGLRYGQALATWNCSYESARGGMYRTSRTQFDRHIRSLLSGKTIRQHSESPASDAEDLSRLCPACESADFSKRRRSARA